MSGLVRDGDLGAGHNGTSRVGHGSYNGAGSGVLRVKTEARGDKDQEEKERKELISV